LISLAWTAHRLEDFQSLANDWDALVSRAKYPAFMRSAFLLPAIRHFGCDRGRLLFARRGPEPVAAALLQRVGIARWQTFQPSQLPLGAWVMTPGCSWSEVMPPLFASLPGFALSIGVTRQDPLFVERPGSGGRTDAVDYVSTSWIDVVGTFEDFWQARGKNLRQNLRKQRRKIADQGGVLAFDVLEAPAEVERALIEFAKLESSGWKGNAGSAITAENTQGLFYLDMLRAFAGLGLAFAFRLSLEGQPIAVDFGIRQDGCAVILKTTYDEAQKAISPGQLLHEQAFEHFFSQPGVRRIEFYGATMEWHSRWTEQSRTLFHLNAYRSAMLRQVRERVKMLVPIRGQ